MKKREIDPLEEIMSNPYYRLRDEYNDAEKIKWTMSFAQYMTLTMSRVCMRTKTCISVAPLIRNWNVVSQKTNLSMHL